MCGLDDNVAVTRPVVPFGETALGAGSFSFTYSLHICVYFLSVGASCARDISAKTLTAINKKPKVEPKTK